MRLLSTTHFQRLTFTIFQPLMVKFSKISPPYKVASSLFAWYAPLLL